MLSLAIAVVFVAPAAMSQEAHLTAHEPPSDDSYRAATQTLVSAAYPRQEAVVSPNGRWIAFTASGVEYGELVGTVEAKTSGGDRFSTASQGAGGIFVIPITGGEPRRVTSLGTRLSDLAWSPDGSKLSFLARPSDTAVVQLYLVDAEGGAPNSVLGQSQYEPRSYIWLADGDIFMTATAGNRTGLFVVSPKTRHIREVDGRPRAGWFSYDSAGKSLEVSFGPAYNPPLTVARAVETSPR